MEKVKACPMTNFACIEAKCAWFDTSELKTEKETIKKNICSILSIAQELQHCSACETKNLTNAITKLTQLLYDRLQRR